MTWGFADAVRNAQVTALRDAVDAGSGAGKLLIYDGTRPATGGAVTTQTLLVQFTLADPCMDSVTGGVGTWDFDPDLSANAESFSGTKTATWCRLVTSADAFVGDGSVGMTSSGADLELSSTSIQAGQAVKVTSGTMTAGNA